MTRIVYRLLPYLVCVSLCGCSRGSDPARAASCPDEAALEAVHELLASVEQRERVPLTQAMARHIERQYRDPGAPAWWRQMVADVLAVAGRYARARDDSTREAALIDQAQLRMTLQDSPCLTEPLHGHFHRHLGMVRVPAGVFTMGCDAERHPECQSEERPARRVELPQYYIDRTEVTRSAYADCVDADACAPVSAAVGASANAPVTDISHGEARAYCQWRGRDLPSEAEWEKAARGTDGRRYPWGDDPPNCDLARYDGCGETPMSVGSFPAGASPYGVLDMAGSAAEWVAGYYTAQDRQRIVRDDAFDAWHMRSTARSAVDPASRGSAIGFRCASR